MDPQGGNVVNHHQNGPRIVSDGAVYYSPHHQKKVYPQFLAPSAQNDLNDNFDFQAVEPSFHRQSSTPPIRETSSTSQLHYHGQNASQNQFQIPHQPSRSSPYHYPDQPPYPINSYLPNGSDSNISLNSYNDEPAPIYTGEPSTRQYFQPYPQHHPRPYSQHYPQLHQETNGLHEQADTLSYPLFVGGHISRTQSPRIQSPRPQKKPTENKRNTSGDLKNQTSFSFSDQNDSMQEFVVSPFKESNGLLNDVDNNVPSMDVLGNPEHQLHNASLNDEIDRNTPSKINVEEGRINKVNLEDSSRKVLLSTDESKSKEDYDVRSSINFPIENPDLPFVDQNAHKRNGSECSTISNASTASTLTPSNNASKDKRFVRYAMNTQSSKTSSNGSSWEMSNVLKWLDSHQFNSSWKDVFRRNEISGNRFLELCNYGTDSMIWRQFTKFLQLDNDLNTIERFIDLLKTEINTAENNFSDGSATKGDVVSRESSKSLLSPVFLNSKAIKIENRKSNPIFHKHKSSSSITSTNSGNLNVHQKQRPFSYIDPASIKSFAKDQPSHHKFFRKNRNSFSDSSTSKEFSSNSSLLLRSGSGSNKKSLGRISSTSAADDINNQFNAPSKAPLKKTSSLQNVTSYPVNNDLQVPGSRKSGILSTLRKYGGDKAAEIVKQVHSSSASTSKNNNNVGKAQKFSRASTSNSRESSSFYCPVSQLIPKRSFDESSQSPRSATSLTVPLDEPKHSPANSFKLSHRSSIDNSIPANTPIEDVYLPVPNGTDKASTVILVTKDNFLFMPLALTEEEIVDLKVVKDRILQSLGLINVGFISYHLTDFNASHGHALNDDVLFKALTSGQFIKIIVHQELASPSVATFSTTSSDSKSFEISGENEEKSYPATPQYLLQNSKDSKTDYWNFKEQNQIDKLSKIQEIPLTGSSANDSNHPSSKYAPSKHFALSIPFPIHRRLSDKLKPPLPLINTTELSEVKSIPSPSTVRVDTSAQSSNNSFKVLRKEGREIDFDKRRRSPYETKAPKLIPNIYSSSVSNQLKSPVSATTVHTLRDGSLHSISPSLKTNVNSLQSKSRSISPNPSVSPGNGNNVSSSTLNSMVPEKSRTGSIVAKRAAPPPPQPQSKIQTFRNTNSLLKSKRSGNMGVSLPAGSNMSEELSFSSRSTSSSDHSFNLKRGFSITKSMSLSRKSTIVKDGNAFKENAISFDDAPPLDLTDSHKSDLESNSTSYDEDVAPDDDEDDFFVKPVKKPHTTTNANVTDDDDDDDDFFVKPIKNSSDSHEKNDSPSKTLIEKPTDEVKRHSLQDSVAINKMSVRPPIDEVYNNLEKYFPYTNLDKPIIDDSPDSPVGVTKSSTPQPIDTQGNIPSRKPAISRTFSNANISPVKAVDLGDEVFYGDSQEPKLSRRRMKTIRIVANEARRKRLEQRQQSTKGQENSQVSQGSNSIVPNPQTTPRNKQDGNEEALMRSTTSLIESSPHTLRRANTKLWGQKVVEVTSTEIEKGFVSKLRNNVNGEFEEFAWIKGELIGRGSFGSVYLALNVTTGEMLAVKQVVVPGFSLSDSSSNSEGIDALHKEVETMKDLDHLNIVQYLGFEQKNNRYSLFLEYVAGGSIASCLKSYGKFDEPLIKFITKQVLLGLAYLHSNGILHRDLKADNLLLEIDGTCKISDFGILKKSKDIYVNNAEMSMQGTVFWMAPEVIDNMVEDKKQGYSAKIDIWSLGCVVLEMFAGKRPWSNEAVVSAIYKIGKTKLAPPIPEDIEHLVTDDAKDFINRCFTIDSEQRPTAKELLEHPFMKLTPEFSFEKTQLGEMIKYNSKRSLKTK